MLLILTCWLLPQDAARASLTWTVQEPALGSVALNGSLNAQVPLGTLPASPDFRFLITLEHSLQHEVESKRDGGGQMRRTVTSRGHWQVPQLTTSLAPEGGDFLRWTQPGGGQVWFRRALISNGFDRAGATDWEIREAGSGSYEIRHRDERLIYRYQRGQLVQVLSRHGRTLHVTSRAGQIQRIEQRGGAGDLLLAAYDPSGRLTALKIGPVEHHFTWHEEVTPPPGDGGRMLEWRSADGRGLAVEWGRPEPGHHLVTALRVRGSDSASTFEWVKNTHFDPADDKDVISLPMVVSRDDHATYRVGKQPTGHRLSRTDALNRTSSLRYHPVRGEVEMLAPDGGGVTFTWRARRGGDALLRRMVSADGSQKLENFYDGEGRLISSEQAGQPGLDYRRDDAGRVLAIHRNGAALVRFDYQGDSPDPVRVTNARGDSISLDYDRSGQIARMTDWRGGDHRYIYDPLGRLTTHVLPMGYQREMRYDRWGRVIRLGDLDGSMMELQLDEITGRVQAVDQRSVGGDRIQWGYEYDDRGRLVSLTRNGQSWQSWQHERQADGGWQVAVTNALGHRSERLFNQRGALVSMTNALGETTTYETNALGELLGWKDPRGVGVEFGRDNGGRIVRQTNTEGQTWSRDFDAMGRMTARDNGEQRVRYQWDEFGRMRQVQYGQGQSVTLVRDQLSRVIEAVLEQDGDAAVRTTFAYDELDRVIARKQELPDGSLTGMSWSYNAAGDRETVTLLQRDAEALRGGEFVRQVNLGGGAEAAGPQAQTTRYHRDLLGRITAVEVDGIERVAYRYDPRTLRLQEKRFSAEGARLQYAWDSMGRIAGMRLVRGTGAAAAGGADEENGVVMKTVMYRWDDYGRLVERKLTGFALQELTEQPGDLATALAVMHERPITQVYRYDALGRLIAVQSPEAPALSESWRYDASGNVIEHRVSDQITSMEHDLANQVSRRVTRSADGRVREERGFSYDRAGRLQRERNGSAEEVASYRYGYLDKVMSVSRGGVDTRFHYDPSGLLVGKQREGEDEMEAWVWDGIALAMRGDQMYVNEPHASGGVPVLARTHAGADGAVTDERLLVSDYLGTTLAAINPADLNGAAVQGDATPAESLLLSTTGTGSGSVGPESSDLARFTGKPYDEDMGAFVFPFRNYRPDLNSWTSADPAGFPDGPNQHFYAPVPTMGIDPLGLEATTYTGTWTRFAYYRVVQGQPNAWATGVNSLTVAVGMNVQGTLANVATAIGAASGLLPGSEGHEIYLGESIVGGAQGAELNWQGGSPIGKAGTVQSVTISVDSGNYAVGAYYKPGIDPPNELSGYFIPESSAIIGEWWSGGNPVTVDQWNEAVSVWNNGAFPLPHPIDTRARFHELIVRYISVSVSITIE